MKIERDFAISIANQIEDIVKDFAHAALGGSTLHKGHSEKDIDIFLYPRQTQMINYKILIDSLTGRSDFEWVKFYLGSTNKTGKPFLILRHISTGIRIDLFILSATPLREEDTEVMPLKQDLINFRNLVLKKDTLNKTHLELYIKKYLKV